MTARVRYMLTEQGAAAVATSTSAEPQDDGTAFYSLTEQGAAALAAWPANRVDHEPKRPGCAGRGCRCVSGRWSR